MLSKLENLILKIADFHVKSYEWIEAENQLRDLSANQEYEKAAEMRDKVFQLKDDLLELRNQISTLRNEIQD